MQQQQIKQEATRRQRQHVHSEQRYSKNNSFQENACALYPASRDSASRERRLCRNRVAKPVTQEQNWFVSHQHLGDGDFKENTRFRQSPFLPSPREDIQEALLAG